MDELALFCCQNPDCPDYGQRRLGNLRVCFRYGPGKQRRMLACRTCQARFSERKGTALFDSRLPHGQALDVLRHLQDDARATLPREVGPAPLDEDREPSPELDQEQDVNGEPQPPRCYARELELTEHSDCFVSSDGRHRSLVVVAKASVGRVVLPGHVATDVPGDETSLLHRDRANPR